MMHPAYKALKDCSIWIEDRGDHWLMCCKRRRDEYRVTVSKGDVASDDILGHAHMTFANILS